MLFSEHADVSVRPAIATDADAIARIQISAWTQTLAEELGTRVLESFDHAVIARQWHASIATAPSHEHKVFCALSGQDVVGFAAIAPRSIVALEVDPLYQREGHGSRLLSAAIDALERFGADEVHAWVPQASYAKSAFLESAGFQSSGRIRRLAVPEGRDLAEERWVTHLV